MNVALLAVDSNYPNLALMKISAYHKSQGDTVEWYNPFDTYDRLYMAKVKWIKRIRFGCDTPAQIAECERAMSLIRQAGYKGEFFLYCILIDFAESYHRLSYWRNYKYVLPHAQPYRDLNNPRQIIPQWQKDMARWTDRKELYRSFDFKDFSPRKGFFCREYFT